MWPRYDYRHHVREDVLCFIDDYAGDIANCRDMGEVAEVLTDQMMKHDLITGGEGENYTFDGFVAWDNLQNNGVLLVRAIEAMGDRREDYKRCITEPETADAVIRQFLLPGVVQEVVSEPGVRDRILAMMGSGRSDNRKPAKVGKGSRGGRRTVKSPRNRTAGRTGIGKTAKKGGLKRGTIANGGRNGGRFRRRLNGNENRKDALRRKRWEGPTWLGRSERRGSRRG